MSYPRPLATGSLALALLVSSMFVSCSGPGIEQVGTTAAQDMTASPEWTETRAIAALADYLYQDEREAFLEVVGGDNLPGMTKFGPIRPEVGGWKATHLEKGVWAVEAADATWWVFKDGHAPVVVERHQQDAEKSE